MIDAANAAKESADAAKTANQITISSNRPVITVSAATIRTDPTNMIALPYKNSGKWTARFVGFHVHALIGDVPPVGIPVVINSSGEKCDPASLDTTPLGPQDGYQLGLQIMSGSIKPDIPSTSAQLQDAITGKRDLWTVGCIGYRDDFGNTYTAPICEYYSATVRAFMFCQITQPPNLKQNTGLSKQK